jgi:hypothetical protein
MAIQTWITIRIFIYAPCASTEYVRHPSRHRLRKVGYPLLEKRSDTLEHRRTPLT